MRPPIFNPPYDPLILSVFKDFFAFTTPFGRDFPCLRLPSNPSATARTAGRSVRTGGFTTPVLSPAPKYPSQKAAETASKPLIRYGYPPLSP